jgi:hypothetical protein
MRNKTLHIIEHPTDLSLSRYFLDHLEIEEFALNSIDLNEKYHFDDFYTLKQIIEQGPLHQTQDRYSLFVCKKEGGKITQVNSILELLSYCTSETEDSNVYETKVIIYHYKNYDEESIIVNGLFYVSIKE